MNHSNPYCRWRNYLPAHRCACAQERRAERDEQREMDRSIMQGMEDANL